uniref:Uncharacterized protein n=1 Tax=Leptobrachium leishanense TaxID=445787 RepID=A0A8C5M8A7_9ANUR
MASADLRDELTCSICLTIYTDPVTLTCGHNFCRTCIEDVLDTQDRSGAYRCPECRAEFEERPALQKNRKLCNIAETFQSSHPEQEDVGIPCTYCDSPVPAAKTCLLCETSLCVNHLKKHNSFTEDIGLIFVTLNKDLDDLVTWAKRQCNVKKVSKKFLDVDLTSNILLDINTAGNNTAVSGDGKTVTFSSIHQGRPEGPVRFMVPQVLSTEGFFSGNHYWEVEEGSTSGGWRVGVTYPSIDRKGVQAAIGNNNKSWALEKNANNQYIAIHDNQSVLLPVTPSCYRLGIFLDYELGQLSFYELGNPIQHLHTVMSSFTEPLHIAIFAGDHGWTHCPHYLLTTESQPLPGAMARG